MSEEMDLHVNRCSSPSELRITDMRYTCMTGAPLNTILVKLYTNQGITGVGELRDGGSFYYAAQLKSRILGENPCNVEKIFKRIKQFGGPARQAGGVSAVETALWDLAGKAYGAPVFQMLGGKYRDAARVYTHPGFTIPKDEPPGGKTLGKYLRKRVDEMGFTMCKTAIGVETVQRMHPGETVISAPLGRLREIDEAGAALGRHWSEPDFYATAGAEAFGERNRAFYEAYREMPYNFYRVTERGLDLYEKEIADMRGELGYETPLAIDHIGNLNLEDCARLLRRLEKYNLAWVEDALPPYYAKEYARLSQMSAVPLATGEDLYLAEGFEPLCRERAVAIVHPDVASCGGILEMKRIGDMAERFHMSMIGHMCETPVAAIATAHVGVATDSFIALEFPCPDVPWWHDMVTGFGGPVIQGGFLRPNGKPGLGFDDTNDELLAEHLMPGMERVWNDTDYWNAVWAHDKLYE
ncbi:MAG: mandelate racemase/muconate lactonizing enzyme family protein [Clostridiales bacterium]|jgi:L-alanine-DL-glutamate epimerase-like enolase superfamily enzyme|nr:mandelate racemase/muconate lactonizing enzyme family protein [Clostridiales bacterium]